MAGDSGGKTKAGSGEDGGKQPGSDDTGKGDSPDNSAQTNIEDGDKQLDNNVTNHIPSSRPEALNRGSWSWRAKATPVASVAKESVFVEQGVSSESADVTRQRPSSSVSKSMRGSRKSIPLVAEATRVHATSDGVAKSQAQSSSKRPVESSVPETKSEKSGALDACPEDESPNTSEGKEAAPVSTGTKVEESEAGVGGGGARPQSGNWLKWWSRPDGYGSDTEKLQTERAAKKPRVDTAEEEVNAPQPQESPNELDQEVGKDAETNAEDANAKPEMTSNSSRSWFRMWSNAQNEQAVAEQNEESNANGDRQNGDSPDATNPSAAPDDATAMTAASGSSSTAENATSKDRHKPETSRPKPSGWAFWSTEKVNSIGEASAANGTQTEVGELAVADTPSQSHPEAAQFNEQRKERKPASSNTPKGGASLLNITSKSTSQNAASAQSLAEPATASKPRPEAAAIPQLKATLEDIEQPAPVYRNKETQSRPNLVLPSFRDSFSPPPTISYLDRLTSYLAQSLHIPGTEPPRPPTYPYISRTPHRVKKAVAIGIHGFFPAAVFNRVIGQPTGTSIRFASYAAASIKQWCQEHQPDVKDIRIEKVALEGEGNIAERVTTLWKLLLNWLSHLRQADFILVAAHSQGVPVATMLIAKLLQLGALAPNVRIGICAMAGINLGPFIEYKSRLFGNTALELFDFCESTSKVSITYADAVDVCLRNNVRITYIGSLDDQLVSLESSLHAPLSHPYVSRAVFMDGRLHSNNFLTHLVVFSVKLRNRGISDHGLLREISAPLAGSLVGGEGHSRVYDDPAVYMCAAEFALESTDMVIPVQAHAVTSEAMGEEDRQRITARRASLSGYPREMTAANHMRRGSLSMGLPGIAPVIAPYHIHAGAAGSTSATNVAEKNPFVLPWAVRGMLEEEAVKKDPELQKEVHDLVREFEQWRPTGKGLKDVRWRLEGVRSLL
jgi:hypothetical protein